MALDKTLLSRIGGSTESSLWMYTSADALATVVAADYFLNSDIQPNLRVDDVIMVVDNNTNNIDFLIVTASTSATVTTATGNT